MRSTLVVATLAAALSACGTDSPSVVHEDALEEQALAWCEQIRQPDRFCKASFRSFYGYRSSEPVSAGDQQSCLADMAATVRGEDGWSCPASCDAIWLPAGERGPIW